MKRHKLMIMGVLGLLTWFAIGLVPGQAQGGVIPPVNASGIPIPPPLPMTVSILDQNGNDVTDSWLPVPNQTVTIRVNDEPVDIYGLVSDGALSTSAYPGECTNYGDPADTGLDFMPLVPMGINSYELTPLDHGGTAVIKFNNNYFIIPQDDDLDGIADINEMKHCGSVDCLDPYEDADLAPVSESTVGDGIAAIDEIRGFRVNGEYIRTDPKIKDLFVGTADTPQCEDGAFYDDPSGSGIFIKLATYFPSGTGNLDMNAVFGNLYTLMPGIAVHYINNDEWQDFFAEYSALYGVTMAGATEQEQHDNAILDRQINAYALMPYHGIVKGVRFIECLDIYLSVDPMGIADKNPPNLSDKDNGNAVVYTQRVYHSLQNKFDQGLDRQLRHYTFENGKWVDKWTSETSQPTYYDRVEIITKALRWYVAHEIIHCTDLTRTDESTRKEPAGYHHVSGTGTNIDLRIVHVVDKKFYPTGFNKFYIPLSYGDSDKRDMRLLETQ